MRSYNTLNEYLEATNGSLSANQLARMMVTSYCPDGLSCDRCPIWKKGCIKLHGRQTLFRLGLSIERSS